MRLDSRASATEEPILGSYEAYGCKVNAIDVDALFRRYEETGFLYPAKMQRLAPFMNVVADNWRRAFRGGELIHYVTTYEEATRGAWGAVGLWRSTQTGWNTQHLVSIGSPEASRAVMLASQAVLIRDGLNSSLQNWFRPDNRFANKVFGSLVGTVGPEHAWVGEYSYLAAPLGMIGSRNQEVIVRAWRPADLSAVHQFAVTSRNRVYAEGEELGHEDMGLDAVDELYRKVGLRRYRRVFLAVRRSTEEIVGVAVAYRGPLGLNFSFLENRCDLIISPALDESDAGGAAMSLLDAVAPVYADFPPAVVPVVTDHRTAVPLTVAGAEFIRRYCQSVWLKDGYVGWYRHVERFYDRAIRGERRHGLAARKAHNGSGTRA